MADDHRSTSPDSLFVSEDEHYNSHENPPRRIRLPPLALPPRRLPHFPGDGLDFRRPVMSGSNGEARTQTPDAASTPVIDLTDDNDVLPAPADEASTTTTRIQRPPRFGRNVIDLESEADAEEEDHERGSVAVPNAHQPNYMNLFPPRQQPYPQSTSLSHPQYSVLRRPQRNSTMDDVEFLEERPLSRSHTRRGADTTQSQRSITPYPANEPIDLTGDDDEIVHMGTQPRSGLNLERPNVTGGTGTRSYTDRAVAIQDMLNNGGRLVQRVHTLLGQYGIRNIANRGEGGAHVQFGQAQVFIGPQFDFEEVGFDMGLPGGNRRPDPPYEPPRAADKGFTRSPGEDEVVVCPKCGDELAVGEGDAKQEVWVIKKCGHVSFCDRAGFILISY